MTPSGVAAINDAVLWLLLGGLITASAGEGVEKTGFLFSLLVLPFYFLVMLYLVRPILTRAVAALMQDNAVGEGTLVVVGSCAIGSAIATEIIGLHYIFGAFFAGVIVPRELRKFILDRLQVMTTGVLMPFFFILTGLRTRIDPSSATFVEIPLLTTILGIVGKVGGTAITAALFGEAWSFALCLGMFTQTKGLMEVVVLTILLEHNVISVTAFSALTLMAVTSTALVMPLARFFCRA